MTKTDFQLPFNGSWLTFWGGDSLEQNIHHDTPCQKYAFDFVQTAKDGAFFKTDGKTNDDYFCFGKKVLTPSKGRVREVVDGIRDNKPGELHSYAVLGNYVIIEHGKNLFSVLAHFKQHSLKIKTGQEVKPGDELGLCGNSGYSSSAHIHYHVQDSSVFAKFNDKFQKVNIAIGQKIYFSNINIKVSKIEKTLGYYSPVKGDVVSNAV